MPLRLSTPILQDFILERSDKHFEPIGEATKVVIKQATQLDHERRSHLLSQNERIFDPNPGEVRVKSNWSMEELKRLEVYCTLAGCNIEDKDGKPLFKFTESNGVPTLDMNMREFEIAWGSLPALVANEIYECVLRVNFDWATPLME
ncbi:MAG: hypothetical protein LLF94_11010 [Chlamydiales bacterium]|nr:hypothetical protein [Chlamydiales bacterium]